jgi:predicted membrane channel-forming protein YqfA (hemolysin III family)
MTGATTDKGDNERLDRELIELLNELRVTLAGVTVLLGFLLTVPFANRFATLDSFEQNTLILAFFSTAASVVTLVAPAAFHRLRWRERDKEALLRTSNRLAITGLICLSVSTTSVVLLFAELFFSTPVAVSATVAMALVIATLWFGLAIARRSRRSPD